MKGKIVLWLISSLMLAILLLVSCAPQAPAPTPTPTQTPAPTQAPTPTPTPAPVPATQTVTVKLTKRDGTPVTKTLEKPKYGGEFVFIEPATRFTGSTDQVITMPGQSDFQGLIFDYLQSMDWSRGLAGTGEHSFQPSVYFPSNLKIGHVADSWEIGPDKLTIIFRIHQGIKFYNPGTEAGRLVNGRELNANDVAFSLQRNWSTKTSYLYSTLPYETNVDTITAPDKWTVAVKLKRPEPLFRAHQLMTDLSYVYPPEVIQKYGGLTDYRNIVGSGPFMMTDFVPQSSATYTKNSNYWKKDPLFPENSVPYIDVFKQICIPDISTQLAAMRTSKADAVRGLIWDDAKQLIATNPKLGYAHYATGWAWGIFLRNDVAPFSNLKVRQALMMGVNRQKIVDEFYSGQADLYTWPLANFPDFDSVRPKLTSLPQEIQDLYKYNPDKAKQLLADAGLPNGFPLEVVCTAEYVDLLSIVKSDYAKIGVDLKLDVKEAAVRASMGLVHSYKHAMYWYGSQAVAPLQMTNLTPGSQLDYSIVKDPKMDDLLNKINAMWPDEAGAMKLYGDNVPYIMSQAWMIDLPATWQYAFWQPWVKNYNGEYAIAYAKPFTYLPYVWMDAAAKKATTGK